MPSYAYEQNVLQIRVSKEALQQFSGNDLPLTAQSIPQIPLLDSLGQLYGFSSYRKLVNVNLKASKQGALDPVLNPVLRWLRIELKNSKALKPALEALEQCKPWVEIAEPVYKVELYGTDQPYFETTWFPNDTMFARQWHYHNTGQTGGTPDADIDLPEAWEIEKGHPSVLVGVLDNGIDTQHVDLRPNLSAIRGYNFVDRQAGLVPGNHGNHTAGTIAARNNNISWVSGIAGGDGSPESGVRLVSCQVFGVPSGSGGLENAFIWSAQNGVAISSNSWGYIQPDSYNQSLLDAIDYFIENGGGGVLHKGLVVFSGGNSGLYERRWPGVYHRVIGVAASNHHDIRSWYSSYHEMLDITAPGGEVNTSSGGPLVNGGRQGVFSTIVQAAGAVGYLQGTSMAAPHVSGVAALIASHGRGRLSADDVKSMLLTTADPIDALQQSAFRGRMGTGRLNAHRALQSTQQWVTQPVIAPPVGFRGSRECTDIVLQWTKAAPGDRVVIAVSTEDNRGGLFGIPVGNYSTGDSITGGGRVIYTGTGSSFRFDQTRSGLTYYFKIWTVANGQYSMGIVPDQSFTVGSRIQSFSASPFCYDSVMLEWDYGFGCNGASVVVAFNTVNSFGEPSGNYQPGDMLGSATVIYTGTDRKFTHLLPPGLQDSASLYYRIYSVTNDGYYSAPIMQQVNLPAALRRAFPLETGPDYILTGWERSSCFNGDVMIAFNTDGVFGQPEGPLEAGDQFPASGGSTVLYVGPASSFAHRDLLANTLYAYSVWPVNDGVYGLPKVFSARTRCESTIYNLPFRDSISPSSLSGCSFDTVGFRNFTAGPWPRLSVAERGEQPSALPFGGRYMLAFNSFDTRERNEVWLTTPPLRSSGIESVDVSYKWYEDGSDYNTDFFAGEGVKLLWSNDYVNWDTVVSSPRITKYGADGWKYKQVTLPATAANQPVLYVRWVFLSRWGYNCYFDEPAVIPTQPKPADGVLTYAVAQFTDSLNLKTNYYNGQEQLLLSIQSEADAGHVNDSLQIGVGGGATALKIGQDNNYVRNSGGWGVTGKYWIVNRWKDQPQPVRIFQYYSFQELLSLQNLASTFLPGAPAAEMPLYSYHIQNNHVTPLDPATGHLNQQAALSYGQPGFWQFDSTGLADTLSFTFRPFISGWHMAETLIKNPGGGGMGKGSASGNGALAAHWLQLSGERRDKTTLLNWTTGYERRWVLMTVERASDLDPDFRELGYISPEGWSQKGSEYSFTDREILPNGNYRYRIKAYDTRSKEYLSPEIRIGIDDTRGLVVFPNPVPSGGSINVFSETNMRWLRIIDQMGRVVLMAQPNATQFRAKLPVLATGIYYVQSLLDSGMKTTRLFISP